MSKDLTDLLREFPDIQVTISLEDLLKANRILIQEAKAELEQAVFDSKAETYLSSEKVLETMEISKTTLWRWKQRGYLVPIRVGGMERYRLSDVKKILEGE